MREYSELPVSRRGLTAMTGAICLIIILLMVQIWLLSAALESFLEGNTTGSLPAAIVSGILFLISAGLYLFVDRIDAEVRRPPR
jgi:hypothetical protein